jgi:ADP-dependent NAD(P)H-hydrate dehydratase / NAD(P)H-hydrate epimerase
MELSHTSAIRSAQLQRFAVTTAQMSAIESRLFAAGMPVAALMEKVAGLITRRVQELYPAPCKVGVLVGSGHNGGDALVVARELYLNGYEILTYCPLDHLKELTAHHAQYALSLGIPQVELQGLAQCDLLIDGLFGFGLNRPLEGSLADAIAYLNALSCPILSIDLPSGVQTDTGAVLGIAIEATHTLCLGLWKRAFLQDSALAYLGQAELIDFGIPLADIIAVLGESPELQRVTPDWAIAHLPLHHEATTHKYQQGHLLLVCGSRQYLGAAILSGRAARASGVGMLSMSVPESLRLLLVSQIPDALIMGCEEGAQGEIARLPDIDLERYDAIACGCGLTQHAQSIVQQVLASQRPLILDADGLNILAEDTSRIGRLAPTILTPHAGEFKRLFPDLLSTDRLRSVQQAAQSGAIVLLKGARTVIGQPDGTVWVIPASTPALARGGSGDVLTGLMGGLMAQGMKKGIELGAIVSSAAWWHAQAGISASQARTDLGVDASTLAESLIPTLRKWV